MKDVGNPVDPRNESIGFAFIKSGYEPIADLLVNDFEHHGLQPIHTANIVLSTGVIDYIYRDSVDRHFYQHMRHYLSTHACIAMVLEHPNKNAQKILHNLKTGTDGYENLRVKYRHQREWLDDVELDLWEHGTHSKQYEMTVALTQQNVFHAADHTDEALRSIQLLLQTVPDFYVPSDSLDRYSTQIGKLAHRLTNLID